MVSSTSEQHQTAESVKYSSVSVLDVSNVALVRVWYFVEYSVKHMFAGYWLLRGTWYATLARVPEVLNTCSSRPLFFFTTDAAFELHSSCLLFKTVSSNGAVVETRRSPCYHILTPVVLRSCVIT
jgi:hypothetical protein